MISSELFEKAVSLIKEEVAINGQLVGINFSSFFGDIVNLIANEFFMAEAEIRKSQERQENRDFNFSIGKTEVGCRFVGLIFTLSRIRPTFFKKPHFAKLSKAISVLGMINCADCGRELKNLEQFAQELMSVQEDAEINDNAFVYLAEAMGARIRNN